MKFEIKLLLFFTFLVIACKETPSKTNVVDKEIRSGDIVTTIIEDSDNFYFIDFNEKKL